MGKKYLSISLCWLLTCVVLFSASQSILAQQMPDEYDNQLKITPRVYVGLLASEAKQIVTGPFHTSKREWLMVGGFAVVEGALFFADEPIQRFSTELIVHNAGLQDISHFTSKLGSTYGAGVLLAFGAYGFLFKDNKMKTTALLATQAYITSGAMVSVIKYAVGRQRPDVTDINHPEPENNVFHGPEIFSSRNFNELSTSFPSGHTTSAFAIATVFASQYKDRLWVPVVAYSTATLVGVSRLTENQHWATDVVAGAALGYLSGKLAVNTYHRFVRSHSGRSVKTTVQFDLGYRNGIIMPGLVCRF